MPLSLMDVGQARVITRIGGADAIRRRLAELGFVVGATVSVVAKTDCGLIARTGKSRMAMDGALSSHVIV